jgi:hypothetical protein
MYLRTANNHRNSQLFQALQKICKKYYSAEEQLIDPANLVETFLNYAKIKNTAFQPGAFEDCSGRFDFINIFIFYQYFHLTLYLEFLSNFLDGIFEQTGPEEKDMIDELKSIKKNI